MHRRDIARRTPYHIPGILAHRKDLICVIVIGDNGRLFENNALASYIHKDTGCAQIYPYIRNCHLLFSPLL